ncbi:MAG: NAD-dependent DNA ligase LigA, partial [Synergistaceae bacterium]|nr:NAD-dependent DNA ligase LigA [Synergistaceae bacterium]
MDKSTEARMKRLVEQLNAYSHAYYMTKEPLVSDVEYDALFDELLEMERETGEALADSPTRRVGAEPVASFLPHRHIGRLWSLDKVKTEEALEEWVQKTRSALNAQGFPAPSFALEYKFDGLTVNLTYRGGMLVQGATRGNGVTGEGILEQIKTVRRVPLTIPF